ncbi:hypothetical protein WA026_002400 [Henosepilachna vigintioctopunctata]|uniref:ADP/ATP translocase n=1 Tax=Henosepilachna vigintioctopunctata TaxID=420089 RepID=A0AAW1U0A3_9CUCU
MSGVDKKTQFWRYLLQTWLLVELQEQHLSALYPLDYVHTRLGADVGKSLSERQYTGLFDCMSKTVKSAGPVGLYRGFLVSVQGIIIYTASYFSFCDTAKGMLPDPKNTPFIISLIAQAVTTVSCITSYPFDTVRRLMMMQSGTAKGDVMYKNTRDCWMKSAKNESGTAFFKGAFSNILRGNGAALVLVFYDEVENLLKNSKLDNFNFQMYYERSPFHLSIPPNNVIVFLDYFCLK